MSKQAVLGGNTVLKLEKVAGSARYETKVCLFSLFRHTHKNKTVSDRFRSFTSDRRL